MTNLKSYIPQDLELQGLKIRGVSVAGIGTSFYLPQYKICFDVAQGQLFAVPAKHIFITHAHQDHAGGIPYLISQRALAGLPPGNFYMNQDMIGGMATILESWMSIEKHQYDFNFVCSSPGDRHPINKDHVVEVFTTTHRIKSQGYTLIQQKKKLKEEYTDLSQQEIYKLKQQDQQIDEIIEQPLISFTGDTTMDFLEQSPQIQNSNILVIEVTYIDDKKSVENSRQWGHIHLDEFLEYLPQLNCRHIVLMHLSSRYTSEYFSEILDKKVSKSDRERLVIFPTDKP